MVSRYSTEIDYLQVTLGSAQEAFDMKGAHKEKLKKKKKALVVYKPSTMLTHVRLIVGWRPSEGLQMFVCHGQ